MRHALITPIALMATMTVQAAKPNFVFVLVDDMGWTGMSTPIHDKVTNSQSDFYQTPQLAKLASQGTRFSSAYSPSSMCTPSRASILTGKSPAQLHMTTPGPNRATSSWQKLAQPRHVTDLPSGEVTIAETLKSNGYATAHFGKWHLNGGGPGKHGFEAHDGATGNDPREASASNPKDIFGITQRSIDFMTKNAKARKPFYLQVSHYAVHSPVEALYATKSDFAKKTKGKYHNNAEYAAMTKDFDTSVGLLLDQIDKLGIAGQTYVIFLSDNGGGTRLNRSENLPLAGGKGSLYEGGIRVPMIIRGPGVKANVFCHTPVTGTDLFPTIRELAGVKSPMPAGVEGTSIVPLLAAKPFKRERSGLVFHYPHYGQGPKQTPQSAIRVGKYKLIKLYESNELHLYDIEKDIGESHDLAKADPGLTASLYAQLQSTLNEIGADLPTVNPSYNATAKRTSGRSGGFVGRFDKNGDGIISKSEFTGPSRRFDRLDKNRNGQLTGDEIPTGPPPQR
jgi:arylsulfatase A-like enzyme